MGASARPARRVPRAGRQDLSGRSVAYASFTVERLYDADPARVFAAWADPAAKSRWFRGPDDWVAHEHELDFREGGHEATSGGPRGGPVHAYRARYWDIVPNERIVYTYELLLEGSRLSVSLTTVELEPSGTGTRLTFTEHGAFFDGLEDPALREHGTGALLDALGRALEG